jgi:hypothetical protein
MIDMTDAQVVTLTVEVPGADDLWLEVKLPVLRAAMLAAIERFRQRADAAKDTTDLDWDTVNSDILIGCLMEYQQNRFFEDKCVEAHQWLEAVPPF